MWVSTEKRPASFSEFQARWFGFCTSSFIKLSAATDTHMQQELIRATIWLINSKPAAAPREKQSFQRENECRAEGWRGPLQYSGAERAAGRCQPSAWPQAQLHQTYEGVWGKGESSSLHSDYQTATELKCLVGLKLWLLVFLTPLFFHLHCFPGMCCCCSLFSSSREWWWL